MAGEFICPRFGKWIGGCKFEGRYDEVENTAAPISAWGFFNEGELRALKTHDIYVYDICVRCGKTVERQKP